MQIVGGLVLISATYALTNKTNKDIELNEAKKNEIVKEVSDGIKPDLDLKLDKAIFDEHEKTQFQLRQEDNKRLDNIEKIMSDFKLYQEQSNRDLLKAQQTNYEMFIQTWQKTNERIDDVIKNP
jgi:hypothetical protein